MQKLMGFVKELMIRGMAVKGSYVLLKLLAWIRLLVHKDVFTWNLGQSDTRVR